MCQANSQFRPSYTKGRILTKEHSENNIMRANNGGKDGHELAKRRRRRSRNGENMSDTASNGNVSSKQGKKKNSALEQEENRGENNTNSRNRESRRYGMIVEDIYIDMEDIICDIQNGKISLDALPKLGLFPLHEAVARGLTKYAESLIELGLQLTSETPDGLTPLEIAVMAGNFDAAALLIQYGAPIDRIRDGIPQFM